MIEPTKEEIQEFWEKCGLDFYENDNRFWARTPSGGAIELLLDLNNLFRYAVDGALKEMELRLEHHVDYDDINWGREQKHYYAVFKGAHYLVATSEDKDAALALFRVLQEATK